MKKENKKYSLDPSTLWLYYTVSMETHLRDAEQWIRRKYKQSIPIQLKDVQRENKKKKWQLSPSDMSRLLNKFKSYHRRTTKKRSFRHHFTTLYPRLGYIQCDLAFFKESLKGYNDQCIGFFLGVDSLTDRKSTRLNSSHYS